LHGRAARAALSLAAGSGFVRLVAREERDDQSEFEL
jgi:hypothetical protein